jgi:hypothetical protein
VAIFSYDGALNFGVTGDFDSAADIGVLCDGIEEGMAQLVKLSAPPAPARAKRATGTAKSKAAPRAARKPRGSRTAVPRGE